MTLQPSRSASTSLPPEEPTTYLTAAARQLSSWRAHSFRRTELGSKYLLIINEVKEVGKFAVQCRNNC